MKRCSVKPYEGKEGYIFISYSHRDKKLVFPIIERLAYDGYRIWYDEGIDPGSEWPEIIANHLNDCAACMAFITENYLKSHNCRREINFALMKKKPFVTVVLEPVVMSPGMEMQLSVTQSVFKYVLPTEDEFYSKLYEAKFLVKCLGQPDHSVRISRPEEYDENWSGGLFSGDDYVKESFRDASLVGGAEDNAANSRELLSGYEQSPPKEESGAAMTFMPPAPKTYQPRQTTYQPQPDPAAYQPQPAVTHSPQPQAHGVRAWLVRTKTNEKIRLDYPQTKLGRSASMVDYVISGNSTIGRFHAWVTSDNGRFCIVDNSSRNKTYLNSEVLEPEREYELNDGDIILLANERFEFRREER